MSSSRSILRAFGSVWLAAVLLMLILVAMAYATVYEVMHGSEAALTEFYGANWFQALLLLLGVNVLAALLARFPFTRRQMAFVVAHLSILLILGGAWVTEQWGIDGSVGLRGGQSTDMMFLRQEMVTLANASSGAKMSIDLSPRVFGPVHSVDEPEVPPLSVDDVAMKIERYLPDSKVHEHVINDNPSPSRAVEVALGIGENEKRTWVFADRTTRIGPLAIGFRVVTDPDRLARMLSDTPTSQPTTKGTVRIEIQNQKFELTIEQCMDTAVPVGETGRTVKILHHLSHATVDTGGKVRNAPERNLNPAIEVEITGPAGTTRQWSFARFPDFRAMHGGGEDAAKVTFVAAQQEDAPSTPVEIIDGGERGLHVRFLAHGDKITHHALTANEPVETPWSNISLTLRQNYDHARRHEECVPVDPPRKARVAAVLLASTSASDPQRIWVQKGAAKRVTLDGTRYVLRYGDKRLPLDFTVKLNRFHIDTYPGTGRPRSFESDVTFIDPDTNQEHERPISMNHPAKHGSYTFYQSSYKQEAGGRSISYLSVAWDPGQPIVFTGYVGMVLGMLLLLIQRTRDRQRAERNKTP